MRKSTSGFTLVEVLIVCIVIVILAAITTVAYLNYQEESRDSKRQADIAALQASLENYFQKNGVYPSGCFDNKKTDSSLGSCTSLASGAESTSLDPNRIGYDTTTSELNTILSGISNDFGDPLAVTASSPFGGNAPTYDNSNNKYRYYYAGSHKANGTYGPMNKFSCPNLYDGGTGGTDPSSYMLAYWSEVKDTWIFVHGTQGSPYPFRTDITAPEYCKYS